MWSIESHTFVAAQHEFYPTLEDVIVLTSLPVFGEARTIKMLEDSDEITLGKEDKQKLETLNKALFES